MNGEIDLAGMEAGRTGIVSGIEGGDKLLLKLESMGIHPGSKIRKISNLFLRGPVILQVGGTEVAIGRRMAKNISIIPNSPEKAL